VLIGLRRSRIGVIIRELDRIKDGFKIPRSTPLHCRVLFGFHQRDKAGLGHLTREDAQSAVIRCLLLLNNYGMHVKFAHARLSEFSAKLGDTLTLSDQQQRNPIELAVHHDPKGLISLLSRTSMIIPWADRKLPRFNAVEIVASADKTQAKLFGNGSRQAHNLLQGFSDIGATRCAINLTKDSRSGARNYLPSKICNRSRGATRQSRMADAGAEAAAQTSCRLHWRVSLPGRAATRRCPAYVPSHVGLLSHLERIIDLNSKVSNRALQLRVSEQ